MRVLRIALYMGLMGVLGWFLAALAIPAAIGWELSEAGVHALPIYGFLAGLALGLGMALVVAVRDTWLLLVLSAYGAAAYAILSDRKHVLLAHLRRRRSS